MSDTTIPEFVERVERLMTDFDKAKHFATTEYGGIPSQIVFGEIEVLHNLAEAHSHLQKMGESVSAIQERRKIPVRLCRCKDGINSECPIHTVDHPAREGCCDQPAETHRYMTRAEFDAAYPELFREIVSVGDERYLIAARRYTNETGVSFCRLFTDNDEAGLGFDLSLAALKALMPTLIALAESGA